MKINVIFFLARFGFGGAGNSVYRLAKSLDSKKYKVSVITLGKCAYKKSFSKMRIKTYSLRTKKLLFSFFTLRKLIKKLINNKSKNILISNINYTNIFCSLVFRYEKKLKMIGVERTPIQELYIYYDLFDFIKKKILILLLKIGYGRFDKIICNSKTISSELKEKFGFKSEFINPPSLKNNKFFKIPKKKINSSLINITTICRISKEKDLEEIIFALNKIRYEKFILNIVGEGKEKQNLKKTIQKLNLSNKVIFHGHKTNISKILQKSDLYINSSLFEGFPNAVVEALYFGVPVIASQSHGGINEILNNGKFGTIYFKNKNELHKKIKNYIKNPKRFINKAMNARKHVAQYNLKNHVKNFESLIFKI